MTPTRVAGPAHPDSYYAATAVGMREYPTLEGSTRADVCVIGGGYTGLSTALHLAEQGIDVVLLEAERIGYGASGRNGGLIGSGQRKDVLEFEQQFGVERAREFWQYAEDAKAEEAPAEDKAEEKAEEAPAEDAAKEEEKKDG